MIVWSGHGYLVVVIVFVSSLLMEMATENSTGNDEFYQQNAYALPAALLIAAGLIFALDRLVFSEDSSQHTLFFIPMKWWSLFVTGIAVVTLGTRLSA